MKPTANIQVDESGPKKFKLTVTFDGQRFECRSTSAASLPCKPADCSYSVRKGRQWGGAGVLGGRELRRDHRRERRGRGYGCGRRVTARSKPRAAMKKQ